MSEKAQCYSRHLVSSACRLSGDRISKTARMNSKKYRTLAQLGAVLLAAAALVPFGALAQQRAPQGQPQAGPTVAAPKGGSAQREGAATADGALRQRVEQLEEQLVDIQVVIGTLESLARGASAPGSTAGARPGPGTTAAIGAADAGRLDSIETQIRALAAQLENLQEQVRALDKRGELPSAGAQAANDAGPAPRPGRPLGDGVRQPERTGFGSVTVSPDNAPRDEIDRVLGASQPGGVPGPQVASAPASASDANADPKQLYGIAYGHLLQSDYGAAEAGFEEFLRRYPNDPMAGSAQYWLGGDSLRAQSIQSCRGGVPEGVSNLRQEYEGARDPAQACRLVATARPEKRGVLGIQRAVQQVSERAREREGHSPDRASARWVPIAKCRSRGCRSEVRSEWKGTPRSVRVCVAG